MKNLLRKYSAFILKILAPLGPWGVFAIAAIDSAAFGLPLDPVVAGYVYERPSWFLIYPLMGAAGSAIGSLVVYFIGLKGEEVLLEKRIPKRKLEQIRDRFERQEFFALMIPSMLPPPTPFKLFVLCAGVFRMRIRDFMLAIFTGRFIRFLILALLVKFFGPEIVHVAAEAFGKHLVLTILGILLVVFLIVFFFLRKPAEELAEELETH